MDGECAELLPLVCALLANPKYTLSDDTCLEKLLDWFTKLTETESLQEVNSCLVGFVSNTCKSRTADPSIISFALKLCGLLASTEVGFEVLQQQNVLEDAFEYKGWSESSLWEDATVRSGWIHGLENMIKHQKAMLFLFKNGLTKVTLNLQTDKSLFVASAANKLLAHILNFGEVTAMCPKGNKTELSGVHKDGIGRQCPEWTDGIMEIMRHLEDSLMSGVPFQTDQSLKLVALSLGHCQPHVREMLWQRTEGAIEVLLGNGQSSLTKLFMEVLQAAARTPLFSKTDSNIVPLMETMLYTLKPTQAIPFAMGIIHLEYCPQSLKRRAIGVILQPLQFVTASTDQQRLCSDMAEENGCQHSALEEQLSQKTSCLSLLCLSLSSTEELAGMDSLPMDIPVQSLIQSVIIVLKVCVGMSFSSSPSNSVLRNLIGCSRVQKCALDTLASLSQFQDSIVYMSEVFTLILQYLDSPDSDATVLQKAFQVILKWLCKGLGALPQDLFPVLKKRLCDVRWEVRDSSLEFLTQLTSHFRETPSYCETLLSSGVLDLLMTLLKDPESYVRASVILALGQTARLPSKDNVPRSGHVVQEDLVMHFMDVLAQDTEVFARRAVVRVLTMWLACPIPAGDLEIPLSTVLELGSEDLDWEVKVHTLELAQILIDQTLAQSGQSTCPYAVVPAARLSGTNLTESLRKLQDLKIFGVLFKGLFDCDRPVAQKACSLLLSLKRLTARNSGLADSTVVCDLQGQTWVEDALKKHLEKHVAGTDWQKPMGFVEVLSVLDLENMQCTLGQSSDHLENSPRSLMEDILAASHVSEDNIVDCY
ncbi:BRCA1-associated ATM activator 1 [Megalops cyprinoides]|uniref:BRCA1-associated ATM activator 1 n=1 Tax=Megalops cyprinoides TaxID=118141 RepID=UPI001864802F|nr:BRCA1-associated ATM activator 1 [Megalops cyprinoides]XP_036397977.1 BRCA1-associated ATM activator 1 [Megalops cyprinoides]